MHYKQTGVKFMSICPGATETSLISVHEGFSGALLFPYIHEFADILSREIYYQP